MVSEKLNSDQGNSAENSGWNMDDMEFAGKDTNEAEKDVLRQEVCEKINRDKRARNIFKKVILQAFIASAVVAAGFGLGRMSNESETRIQNMPVGQEVEEVEEVNDASSSESETPSQKISVEQVVENANHFVDREDDDLVWFEDITDNSGTTIGHGNDSTAELNSNQIGEIKTIEMDWWEGRGDMFRVTDTNADGKWDVAQRKNPYEDNSTYSINLKNADSAPDTMSGIEQLFANFPD